MYEGTIARLGETFAVEGFLVPEPSPLLSLFAGLLTVAFQGQRIARRRTAGQGATRGYEAYGSPNP